MNSNRSRSIAKLGTAINHDIMAFDKPIVEYWDDPYVQRFKGDCYTEVEFSLVDMKVLYDGLDELKCKVASDTTGLESSDWFDELEPPDVRLPFEIMVSRKV